MRNRDTERRSNRENEKQRNREAQETEEKEDIPPLVTCVKTLQEAVQISLADGITENCFFVFARAIKAFEITHNRRLTPAELQSAFATWWSAAKPSLPADADYDEWRFDFEDIFAKTHSALGANSLQEAIRRAETNLTPYAARYSSPKLQRLTAVCYHLQMLQGSSPFFLGVRDAAKITKIKNLYRASAMLNGLVRDHILILVEKSTSRRATRFRFNLQLPHAAGTPLNDLIQHDAK
ncbi:MAG TPA: hypothetical protein VFW05_13055 [Verrucomicrobiae bacterium]|nr:hypothetical protein [Verrucomicrobiae bacterium]